MSDGYSQKLWNWLASVLSIALIHISFFSYSIYEYILRNSAINNNYQDNSYYFSGHFLNIAMILAPVLIWHFSDFVQRRTFDSWIIRIFERHRYFLCAPYIYGALGMFVISPFMDDFYCWSLKEEERFGLDPCGEGPWPMKGLAHAFSWLAICLLALGKLVVSIASRIRIAK